MNLLKIALSIPKILYLNIKLFPLQTALKLPVWVHYNVKIANIHRGAIEIASNNIKPGMIKLGCSMGSSGVFDGEYPAHSGGGYIDIKENSKIIFKGIAHIAGGFSIRVDDVGIISFGDHFTCNSYCFFASNHGIIFGDNCTLGWKVNIRDADGHDVYLKGDAKRQAINLSREVIIGEHVWIAACVDILKGSCVPDNCVVAYGTLLTGQKFKETDCIIGGNPPKVIKDNINWRF